MDVVCETTVMHGRTQENICDTIYTTSERLCPGLYLERAPLSASHLSQGVSTPHAYTPRDVVLAHLAGTTYVLADCVDRPEMLVDLIAFGDSEVQEILARFDECLATLQLNCPT